MARAYQRTVNGTTQTIVADCKTLGGGPVVVVKNLDAATLVYLCGDENVDANAGGAANAATVGFPLAAGATSPAFVLSGNEAIYASATTTVTVAVFRTDRASI